ncbi:hypothetical protein CF105_19890 [Aeromonas veronii]|nr:hypothetical protein CF105_19890 [Aeromonas veronii]
MNSQKSQAREWFWQYPERGDMSARMGAGKAKEAARTGDRHSLGLFSRQQMWQAIWCCAINRVSFSGGS